MTPHWRPIPRLVSTLRPFSTAQMELLPPRWQQMSFRSCRPIRSAEDGPYVTSLETYCYGELLTASRETLACFQRYYAAKAERGENLYIEIQTHTARLLGYGGLEEAERVLCANTRSCCHHDPMTNG